MISFLVAPNETGVPAVKKEFIAEDWAQSLHVSDDMTYSLQSMFEQEFTEGKEEYSVLGDGESKNEEKTSNQTLGHLTNIGLYRSGGSQSRSVRYSCKQCKKLFKRKAWFENHVAHCMQGVRLLCKYCPYETMTVMRMRIHYFRSHNTLESRI